MRFHELISDSAKFNKEATDVIFFNEAQLFSSFSDLTEIHDYHSRDSCPSIGPERDGIWEWKIFLGLAASGRFLLLT